MTTARTLSLLIALLALAQSAFPVAYRDDAWITAAFRGNDVVTPLLAVPLLFFSSRRNSERARLVWLAALFYMVYNYAFYLFGATINRFFPIYVALEVLSLFTMISVATRIEAQGPGVAHRWVAGFMVLLGTFIAVMWLAQWLGAELAGKLPQLGGTEPIFRVVAAVDLTLQVPFLILGGIWLWQGRPWGYRIATTWMLADAVYMVVLLAFSPFAAAANLPDPWGMAPVWAVCCAGCLASTALLLKRDEPRP